MSFPRRICMAGLVLSLTACLTSHARAVDPKYLPGDTQLLISLNLKQMLESAIAKQYKDIIDQGRGALEAQIQSNPAAKYLEKAGFDVLRDLHAVTVASNGGKDFDGVFLIIEGKFSAAKVQAAAEEIARENAEVLKISKLGAVNVYEITPPGDKRVFAAMAGDSMLIAAQTQDSLKDALAGMSRKDMKDSFKSLLKTVSNKQSLSFAATGPALSKLVENAPVPNADAVAGMLQNVDGISAAITLAKDIQFQIGVNAKDKETSDKMVAVGNFGLLTVRTLAAQKAKEDEKLQPLVDVAKTLRITAEGNNMILRGEVSLENLEKLMKVLPNNFNR